MSADESTVGPGISSPARSISESGEMTMSRIKSEDRGEVLAEISSAVVAERPSDIDMAVVRTGENDVAMVRTSENDNSVRTGGDGDGQERKKKKKKIIRIIRKKAKPARPQVDPATFSNSEPPPQTGTIFNIWYNKWAGGDREDKYLTNHKAPGRCNASKDAGYTRADSIAGSFFCLFFARGLCPKGVECEYLHRLPTVHDIFNPNTDCFGRDKFSDYRDDMGGVGSFARQNRTLYVGRIHVSPDVEEVVARHFQEWGDIERTRVLANKGVAFVTYANEANSQFAKEAMAHQSLDHDETLNVRWATEDPNPQAKKRNAASLELQAAEAIRRALPAEYLAQIGFDPSNSSTVAAAIGGPSSSASSSSRGPSSGPKRLRHG